MGILDNIFHFFVNGFSVFCNASLGKYQEDSQEIKDLKHEMFVTSNFQANKENLKNDSMKIAHDVRTAFNKLVLSNGETISIH